MLFLLWWEAAERKSLNLRERLFSCMDRYLFHNHIIEGNCAESSLGFTLILHKYSLHYRYGGFRAFVSYNLSICHCFADYSIKSLFSQTPYSGSKAHASQAEVGITEEISMRSHSKTDWANNLHERVDRSLHSTLLICFHLFIRLTPLFANSSSLSLFFSLPTYMASL